MPVITVVFDEVMSAGLAAAFHKTGNFYDSIEVEIYLWNDAPDWDIWYLEVDYVEAEVAYTTKDYSPFVETITANGTSDITTALDVNALGVGAGDLWKIGESIANICAAISAKTGVAIVLDSHITGYIALDATALTAKAIISEICLRKGACWFDLYTPDGRAFVYICQPAYFPTILTGIDSSTYSNLLIERPLNQYREVWRVGNRGLEYHAVDYDGIAAGTNTSPLVDRKVYSSLNTIADVREAAENELAILKDLRPSLQFDLPFSTGSNVDVATLEVTHDLAANNFLLGSQVEFFLDYYYVGFLDTSAGSKYSVLKTGDLTTDPAGWTAVIAATTNMTQCIKVVEDTLYVLQLTLPSTTYMKVWSTTDGINWNSVTSSNSIGMYINDIYKLGSDLFLHDCGGGMEDTAEVLVGANGTALDRTPSPPLF